MPGMPSPAVSVVILGTRPDPLRRCLASLAACEEGPQEVVLVLNGGGEECLKAARSRPGLPLRLLRLPPVSLGRARNLAVAAAGGEAICFLDDDVTVPSGFFPAVRAALRRHPAAAALGGPNRTAPGRPLFERLVGLLLESPLGAGPMRRRYAGYPRDAACSDRALMLCNLVVRREALRASGARFPEALKRNEENVLLADLSAAGCAAVHCPDLEVFHERRSGWRAFARQCFLSGVGRAQMSAIRPRSVRPIFLAPAALWACLAAAPWAPAFCLPPIAAYALATLAEAARLALAEGAGAALRLWALFPVGHLSYGAGFLCGLPLLAAAGILGGARRHEREEIEGKEALPSPQAG